MEIKCRSPLKLKHRSPPKLPYKKIILPQNTNQINITHTFNSTIPVDLTNSLQIVSNINTSRLSLPKKTPLTPQKKSPLSPQKKSPLSRYEYTPRINKKKLFMSHTWRYDILNRDTHNRVRLISNALRNIGYTTWFDEDDMINGNIDISMADGIDNCDCFIVCLTKNYINKINEASKNMLMRDNCYKEFNYANVSNKIMIPLILEPGVEKLPGIIGVYLGNQYFIDFSFSDYKSKKFHESIEKLNNTLIKYKILENPEKKYPEQLCKFKNKLYNSIYMYNHICKLRKLLKSFIQRRHKADVNNLPKILYPAPSFKVRLYREIIKL